MIVCLSISANAQFNKFFKQVKDIVFDEEGSDIGMGLKEALELGVEESVKSLSAKKGYFDSPYRILIPEEAQKVVHTISKIPGFTNVEADLLSKMNEAAELAAKKATPIFVDAIKAITFKDAMEILMGDDNAATLYLQNAAQDKLYTAFLPVIQQALDEVNAREYWTNVVTKYNRIPFTKNVNPRLDDHVNKKALYGLFSLIEKKEKGIRNNIDQRPSELLQKIFGKQDIRDP